MLWNLNYVLMLNWIAWNGTAFVCETELIDVELFLTLNWIGWIRTVWLNWTGWNKKCFRQINCIFRLNWIVWKRTVNLQEMDLSLNNLQSLIYHKPPPQKTQTKQIQIYSPEYYAQVNAILGVESYHTFICIKNYTTRRLRQRRATPMKINTDPIYQPLRSGRIGHKVNF